jgi:hypothetical protein
MNNPLDANFPIAPMRRLALAGAVAAALLVAGCDRDTASPPTPEVAASNVRQKTGGGPDSTSQHAARERYEFVAQARREMDELRSEIAQLRERTPGATGLAREELRQEIDEMEAKWRDADLSLERLRTESTEAWREMKKGLGEAMAELKQSYQKAREELDRS